MAKTIQIDLAWPLQTKNLRYLPMDKELLCAYSVLLVCVP